MIITLLNAYCAGLSFFQSFFFNILILVVCANTFIHFYVK